MEKLEKKTILKNIGWLTISKIIVYLLSIITITLIPRYLGVTGYGQFNFVLSFIGIFSVLSGLGLNFLITRDISKDKTKAPMYFNNLFLSKILVLVLISIIIFITTYFLNKPPIVNQLIYLGIVYLFIKQLSGFIISFFNAYEKMQFRAFLEVGEKFFYTIFAVLIIILNKGIIGVMLSKVISIFIVFLFLYYFITKLIKIKPKLNNKFFKKTLLVSWPFLVSALFYTVYFHFDRILISLYLGDYHVGLYAISYTFIGFILGFLTIFRQVFFPIVSRTKEKLKLTNISNKLFKLTMLFSIPIFLGSIYLSKQIISLVFGTEYLPGNTAFSLVMFFMLIFSINLVHILLLETKNLEKYVLKIRVIASVLNVLLNLIIIPIFGIIGAAITTIISELIIFILSYFKVNKKLINISYFKNIKGSIISSIFMILIIYLVKNYINYRIFFNSLDVLILIAIGILTYFSFIFITKTITIKEIKNIIKTFKKN